MKCSRPRPPLRRRLRRRTSARRGKVSEADVLQHADRDERVELAAHVAVVVVDELDAAREALRVPRASRAYASCSRETLKAFTRTP